MNGEIPKVTVTNEGAVMLSCEGIDKLPKAVQDGLLDMIRDAVSAVSEHASIVSECLDWESLEALASDCSLFAGKLYNETYGDTYEPYRRRRVGPRESLDDDLDIATLIYLLMFYSRRRALKAKG